MLSACSHAGIVNACLGAAKRPSGDAPLDLVLGGYHLAGASMEQRIEATVDDLASARSAHRRARSLHRLAGQGRARRAFRQRSVRAVDGGHDLRARRHRQLRVFRRHPTITHAA